MFKTTILPLRHKGTMVHEVFLRVSSSLCVLVAIFLSTSGANGQTKVVVNKDDPKKPKTINVKHAANLTYDRDRSNAKFLTGNVIFEHDGALLNCDTALLFEEENRLEATGNILITKGDSITVTGKKLYYDGKSKMATLQHSVTCIEKDMTLTTDSLNFDIGNSIANYHKGGKIVNKENTLTSKNGHYYSATKELAFHYDVELKNPDKKNKTDTMKMRSDTLRYNTTSKTAYFLGPSIILSKDDYIYCENGWYDTEKEKAQFSQHAVLVTKQQKLKGDSLLYDRNLKIGRAFRNVMLIDTAQKSILYGDYVEYHEKRSEAWVTLRATYSKKTDKDSLFIAADTLYHRDIDSVDNFLNAYHNVRVFKKDIQAMCDSATLNTKDSLMQLYKSPLLWTDRSQAMAKHIKVFIGKSTVKGFKLEGNSFLIQQADSLNKYNQLIGKTIEGFLADDSLRKIVILGNAEIYYYPMNEKKRAIGLNKTTANEITMWLKNGDMERVSFKAKSEGKIDPIKTVDVENSKLKGFNWQYEKRPKTKSDLHPNAYKLPDKFPEMKEEKPEVLPKKSKKKKK